MARKKKIIPPVKDHFIGFKVTDAMFELIKNEALLAKLSVSEYCRKVIVNKRIVLKKEVVFNSPELLSALSNLGRIGNNLNQIARHLNGGGNYDSTMKAEIIHCINDLRNIREDVKKMAGTYRGNI